MDAIEATPPEYNGFDLVAALLNGDQAFPIETGRGAAALDSLDNILTQTSSKPIDGDWALLSQAMTPVRELYAVLSGTVGIYQRDGYKSRFEFFDGQLVDLLPSPFLADIVALYQSISASSIGGEKPEKAEDFPRFQAACDTVLHGPVTSLIDQLIDVDSRDVQVDYSGDALLELVSRRARVKAADYARDAALSAQNARQASGAAARDRQGETLASIYESELAAARFWTQCAFGLIGLGIVLPAVVLALEFDISAVSGWVTTIVKLAFSLPIFGAAAYSARIAAQHREHARRMRLLAVQVDTLESFVEPMSETAKTETRALFARRLFAESAGLAAPAADTISVIPAELIPLLERVVEQSKGKDK